MKYEELDWEIKQALERRTKHKDVSMTPTTFREATALAESAGYSLNDFINMMLITCISQSKTETRTDSEQTKDNEAGGKNKYPRKVYAIQHNETGRIYIGSTGNMKQRIWAHIRALRNGNHTNKEMQRDFNKYGEKYSFFVLDCIEDSSDDEKEFEWMVNLNTTDAEIGYNTNDPHFRGKKEIDISITEGLPTPNKRADE